MKLSASNLLKGKIVKVSDGRVRNKARFEIRQIGIRGDKSFKCNDSSRLILSFLMYWNRDILKCLSSNIFFL